MNEKLLEYIRKRVESGNDIEEIKQALLSVGHEISVVEEHIAHVLKHKKLKDYIKENVQIGSDIEKLKQYLVSVGYDISIIEEHINNALKEKKNKKKTLPMTFIAIILIVILVAGFYYFYYHYPLPNKKTYLPINESRNEEIQNEKNLELLNKALISNELSVCEQIAEQDLKDECKNKFLFNASNAALENVSEELKLSRELLNKALINRNPGICIEITDNATKNACEQNLGGVTENGKQNNATKD